MEWRSSLDKQVCGVLWPDDGTTSARVDVKSSRPGCVVWPWEWHMANGLQGADNDETNFNLYGITTMHLLKSACCKYVALISICGL